MRNDNNVAYGIIISSIVTVLGIMFLFSRAIQIITDSFFNVFLPFVIAVPIFFWFITWLETKKGVMTRIFSFNERVPGSKLSEMPLLLKIFLIGGLLSIIFSAGAFGLGSPIIDVPEPFTQESFSQVNEFDKIYYQALIPGFFEEGSIYIIVQVIKSMFILGFGMKNPKQLIVIFAISALIGAGILTYGHRVAYGSDTGAFIGVFTFEFVMQFTNLYTGVFVSWMPHVIHNAVVTLSFMVAFSIGSLFFMKNKRRIEQL